MQKSHHAFLAARILGLALSVGLFRSSLRAETTETKTTPIAIGAEFGTAGIGPAAIFTASEHFTATVGYTWFNYTYNTSSSDTDYNGKLKLSNLQAIANWHPFAGTFHLSAGFFISDNKVDVTAKAKSGTTYDIGGTTYTADQVGSVSGNVKLAKNAVPYIGLGWAKKPLKGGLGFFADIGVVFSSTPQTKLIATGPIASDTTFQANLQKEENNINHDLKPLRYYPVVQAGLMYRF